MNIIKIGELNMLKNKMNLKSRKKKKINLILYLIIIYMAFAFTYYYSLKDSNIISNERFITYILNGGNVNNISDIKLSNIVNKTINLVFKFDIKNPTSILKSTSFNNKREIVLEHNDDYSNLNKLKQISSYIEDPYPSDVNNPVIYLYNTHQLENYSNDNLEIYGITPNVLMASYLLKEKLNKLGISTVVEDTNITDFLAINNWDYSSSYKASRILALDKINKYSSLKYLIDIHRDSVSKEISTTTIEGKSYAKMLFVIGMENSNNNNNLQFANSLNELVKKHYPGLSRGILKKEGEGVDGVYNQDLSSFSTLIEVGGKDNTINEVLNTIEAISNIIYLYINGDNS